MAQTASLLDGLLDEMSHTLAVVTPKAVAVDTEGGDVFTPEDVVEDMTEGGGACTGRTGNRDDRMFA